jgi:peroxiredoxin
MYLFIRSLLVAVALPLTVGATAPPQTATLSGHLDHAPAGDTVRVWYGFRQVKAPLSKSGDFKLVISNISVPTTASLSFARQRAPLYLSPGDHLHLTLDFSHFEESMRYTGRGAAANNYLAQTVWQFDQGHAAPLPEAQRTPDTTPAQMRQLADVFRQQQHTFLQTYAAKHSLTPAFQKQAALDIDLLWARQLLDYPGYYRHATQHAATLPTDYYNFLKQLPHQQLDEQLNREPVLRFLMTYGGRLLPDGPLRADSTEARRLYAQATTDLGAHQARDWAMYRLLSFQLLDNVPAVVAAYPTFRQLNQDSTLARELRQQLQGQLRVQPGQLAPAFTLLNQQGRAVSLTDFKGKVVYLDFWGTWCAPCRQELPASNSLAQQFNGREVVFVAIAVGDPAEKWQQVVAAEHLNGPNQVQLRSPDAAVPTAYQVGAFPTYLLIGRDGRIRSAAAPRPSAGAETVKAIEQALKE